MPSDHIFPGLAMLNIIRDLIITWHGESVHFFGQQDFISSLQVYSFLTICFNNVPVI